MTALNIEKKNFSRIKRRSRRYSKPFILSLLFLSILGLVFFLLKSPLFKINKLSCFINDSICNPALYTKTASEILGKNYLVNSQEKLRSDLKSVFPNSQEIFLKKDFAKVEVKFSKGKPFVVVEKQDSYFLVDEIGFVLEKLNSPQDYFLLSCCTSFADFENHINIEEVSKALEFVSLAKQKQLPLLKGEVCKNSIKFFLKNGEVVLVSLEKEISKQVDSLQLILNESKITKGQVGEIDLRYQNPVIR